MCERGRGLRRGEQGWDGARKAQAPVPRAEEGELGHRPGQPRGIVVFRSWLQTLASWMPSVDERCIME